MLQQWHQKKQNKTIVTMYADIVSNIVYILKNNDSNRQLKVLLIVTIWFL